MSEENLDLNEDISMEPYAQDILSDPWVDPSGVSPLEKHTGLLKELTDFDPIIQKRIRNWLGLEWDEEVKDYVPKQPAIINERGARWAIGFLQTYQSKTNFITNISRHEFNNLQLDIITLSWLVFLTNDHFGVKNNADWFRLATELQHSAFLVLAGAGDGKYTKFLGESVTRTETVNLSPSQPMPQYSDQPSGFFSGIKNKLLGRK